MFDTDFASHHHKLEFGHTHGEIKIKPCKKKYIIIQPGWFFVINWVSSYLCYFSSLDCYSLCFHCSYLYNYYNYSRILYIKYTILCIKPCTQYSTNLNFGSDFISGRSQYILFFCFNKVSLFDSHTRENQWSGFQFLRGLPQIRIPRWYSKILLLTTQHSCSH